VASLRGGLKRGTHWCAQNGRGNSWIPPTRPSHADEPAGRRQAGRLPSQRHPCAAQPSPRPPPTRARPCRDATCRVSTRTRQSLQRSPRGLAAHYRRWGLRGLLLSSEGCPSGSLPRWCGGLEVLPMTPSTRHPCLWSVHHQGSAAQGARGGVVLNVLEGAVGVLLSQGTVAGTEGHHHDYAQVPGEIPRRQVACEGRYGG
jgi:hypothetical protein